MARPEKYPFAEYADGEVHEIDCLTSFAPPKEGGLLEMDRLRSAFRTKAWRLEKTAHFRLVKGERPRLLVQIVDKGTKPAPVFKLSDFSAVLHGRKACPTCGRSAAQTEPASEDAPVVTDSTGRILPAAVAASIKEVDRSDVYEVEVPESVDWSAYMDVADGSTSE